MQNLIFSHSCSTPTSLLLMGESSVPIWEGEWNGCFSTQDKKIRLELTRTASKINNREERLLERRTLVLPAQIDTNLIEAIKFCSSIVYRARTGAFDLTLRQIGITLSSLHLHATHFSC